MGIRKTTRQDGAQHVRPSMTAHAARATASASRVRQAGPSAGRALNAHASNGEAVSTTATLPTIQREHTLARGPLQLFGAQGVRNPGQRGAGQGGVAAGVRLSQPAGGGDPGLCLTDGRAVSARTGTKRVPPVWAGRLVPRDDWR